MALFGRRTPADTAEVRAPAAATKALSWLGPGQAQAPRWDARRAFEIAYYMSVVVYACTRLHANVVGSLPFRVGADPDKPNDYDPNHPLARLLGPPPGGPAPKLSSRRLWSWTTAQRIVTGRNAWEIETDPAGRPIALWPLASSHLDVIPTAGGADWFAGFLYGSGPEKRRLPVDRVVYDWSPRGDDFRQAESALEAAGLSISVDVMQARYDWAFLKNDARPAAIVVTEEFEDADAYRAFQQQWNSSYGGVDNAGRMAFLEATGTGGVTGAVDVKVLGFSPKDAQAAERHVAAMERTAIALGTPWSLLDASGRTFSNAGQEWQNWVHLRLMPLLTDLQDMVNMQLAPAFGQNVGWFDLSSLQLDDRVDPITASVGAPSLVQAQLMTINEARADYGLPGLPDGDRMMTVDEIVALKSVGGVADPAMRAAEPQRSITASPALSVREVPPSPSAVAAPPAPPAVDEDRAPTPEEIEARRSRIWHANNSTATNLERVWERRIRRLFARQERSALARLDAKRGRQLAARAGENSLANALANEIFDPEHWRIETADETMVLYEQVVVAAGAQMADRFGVAFDLDAPYVADYITERANQLAGAVTETTYGSIKAAMQDGVAGGESIPELAARIREVFATASKSRAVTIARTEVISAYNGAGFKVAAGYGPDVVAGMEWIATPGTRTRDAHRERNGDVVAIGELFSGGMAYPGDPAGGAAEVVNCRCTVAYLTPEDFTEASANRSVPVDVARAVIGMIRTGDTRHTIRTALRAAA